MVLSAKVDGLPSVYADNPSGIFSAMDWLYTQGHRRFGFLGGSMAFYDAQQRLHAFRQYLQEHDLPYHPEWIAEGDFTAAGAVKGAKVILSGSERLTAILAVNDETAAGVLQTAQELGIPVPEELSVVGFDDTPFAQVVSPRLSTIHQPLEQMATTAVALLMQWIEQWTPPERKEHPLSVELVLRESTAPAFSSLHHYHKEATQP